MDRLSQLEGLPDTPGANALFLPRFDELVRQQPDHLAVISCHQPANLYGFPSAPLPTEEYQSKPYLRWTYQTLSRCAHRLVSSLARHDLKPGTPLIIICGNQVEYLVAMLAAFRLGLVFVPFSPEAFVMSQDTKHILDTIVHDLQVRAAVIMAADSKACIQVSEMIPSCDSLRLCFQTHSTQGGCIGMGDFLEQGSSYTLIIPEPRSDQIVLHTSGSTSKPKSCLIKANQWFCRFRAETGLGTLTPEDRVALTAPTHHMFGFVCITTALLQGAAVVFPELKFHPDVLVRTIQIEGCSFLPIIPSMIHSILAVLEDPCKRPVTVRRIFTGGMSITPGTVMRALEMLNAVEFENMYGMTEGLGVATGALTDLTSHICKDYVAIGRPVQGTKIRIRDPETGETVPRGTWGELHFCGPTLINGYMGNPQSNPFYEQDGERWINTGDAAFISDHGAAYIVGRYKDLIVRGGENISPARLEAFVAAHPSFSSWTSQVVAAADGVAGEVPVLITGQEATPAAVKLLKESTRDALGAPYVPAVVLSLRDLGLQKYPLTASGKVQKNQLRGLVKQYLELQGQESPEPPSTTKDLALSVTSIWSKTLGIAPDHLNIDAPLARLADSMLMISAREKIRKSTGYSVPIQDWLAAGTIANQIKLLESSSPDRGRKNIQEPSSSYRQGPPTSSDLVHLGGGDTGFGTVKKSVEKVLQKDGFGWNDVQDIFPCTDFFQMLSLSGVIDSWNIRTSMVSHRASVEEMRAALEVALRNHPILLSYLVHVEQVGLYVTIRPTSDALVKCITNCGVLNSLDELRQLMMENPGKAQLRPSGPSFHALIAFVKETQSAAVMTNMAHTFLDASSFALFSEDLDQAFSGRALPPRASYQTWTESLYTLRQSPKARAAVQFHAQRLRDLRQHSHALWPLPTDELIVHQERMPHNGHTLIFSAPVFVGLQQEQAGLTAPIIMKAALAAVCLAHTNHTHAVFCSFQAARSEFPFIHQCHKSLQTLEAPDVAGPTLNGVLELVDLCPGETGLQFLSRVSTAQQAFNRHASVPWHEVFQKLDLSTDILPAIANSLIFNWQPGLPAHVAGQNPFQRMRRPEVHIRTRLGLLANAGAAGPDGSQIIINLHGAIPNTSAALTEKIAEQWKTAALWLADPQTRNAPVTEIVRLLQADVSLV